MAHRFCPLPLALALVASGMLATSAVHAESWSTTNAQLLYGRGFDDPIFEGRKTTSGALWTLTLEHFGAWSLGDNYFFLDVVGGDFAGPDGSPLAQGVALYGEWAPRLSMGKIARRSDRLFGPVDLLLAGQGNFGGDGFWAGLVGAGIDVRLPKELGAVGLNGYLRDDKLNAPTFQLTPYWLVTLRAGRFRTRLEGFADIAGTDELGIDFVSQPQVLLDVAALFTTDAENVIHAGGELYLHVNRLTTTTAPQAMVNWVF